MKSLFTVPLWMAILIGLCYVGMVAAYWMLVLLWLPRFIQRLISQGKFQRAIAIAEWTQKRAARLVKDDTGTANIRWSLAVAYNNAGRYQDAVSEYEPLLKVYADEYPALAGQVHIQIAQCLDQLQRPQEAHSHRVRGLEFLPEEKRSLAARLAQVAVYRYTERYAEAALECEMALTEQSEGNETGALLRYYLVEILLEAGRHEEALETAKAARRYMEELASASQGLSDTFYAAWGHVAVRLAVLGNRPAADAFLDAGRDAARGNASFLSRLYRGRFDILFSEGRDHEAANAFEEFLQCAVQPQSPLTIVLNRAHLLREANPKSAWAMLEMEQPDGAAGPLEPALWHAIYAYVAARLGERVSATEHLQTALTLAEGQDSHPGLSLLMRIECDMAILEAALVCGDISIAERTNARLETLPVPPIYAPLRDLLLGDLRTVQERYTEARVAYRKAASDPLGTAYSERARERWASLAGMGDGRVDRPSTSAITER